MITRRIKFIQSSFQTEEKGARNLIMQDVGDKKGVEPFEKPSFLDGRINDVELKLRHIDKSTSDKEANAIRIEYNGLIELKKSEIQAKTQSEKNRNDEKIARKHDDVLAFTAENNQKGTIAQANAKMAVAKIQQDPNEISQTEMDVFNIIKKYDFLKDPEAFKNLVNTTTDNSIKADALTLEKDLKKLGVHLTVASKIDENTIDAVEALISKNAPAIKAYKEVTGIDPLRPSYGGTKPVIEKDGR